VSFLPAPLYDQIEKSMPIACVDFVSIRHRATTEVGLIRRESPFGVVWCHLGGRINRGETIAQALCRHANDTLDVSLNLPDDPQPDYVYQWFPPAIAPNNGIVHGDDPRKHAIGLSFVVEMAGDPQARNEAIDFAWFAVSELPEELWPGTEYLIRTLLDRCQIS
jgi:ADP-ribose pyrophosphatase YjhB (NUDIX family)